MFAVIQTENITLEVYVEPAITSMAEAKGLGIVHMMCYMLLDCVINATSQDIDK